MTRWMMQVAGALVPVVTLLAGCAGDDSGEGSAQQAAPVVSTDDPLLCKATGFDGRATGLEVAVRAGLASIDLGAAVVASDTGPLPATGSERKASLLDASLASVAFAGVLAADTVGDATSEIAHSTSSVTALAIHLPGLVVTANVLQSTAIASCGPKGADVYGAADIAGLRINDVEVVVSDLPNQTIDLGVATIVINELTDVAISEGRSEVHVAALHVTALGVADVVVSAAQAGIDCSCDTFPSDPPSPPSSGCTTSSQCARGQICYDDACRIFD